MILNFKADGEAQYAKFLRSLLRPLKKAIRLILLECPEYADTPDWVINTIALEAIQKFADKGTYFLVSSGFGTWDSYWVSLFLAPHAILGEEYTEDQLKHAQDWANVATCGVCLPTNLLIICADPASEYHIIDGVMNNDSGPAVTFRDGLKCWVLNDVEVDEQIVMFPETQTISQIDDETNEEVKRIRLERYGVDKYLDQTGAMVLDFNENFIEGTKETLLKTKNGMLFLTGVCPSTGRVYYMEILPDEDNGESVTTASEAQSWLRNSKEGFCLGAS